jgi:regulator of cell morphogenesis and NO signaling
MNGNEPIGNALVKGELPVPGLHCDTQVGQWVAARPATARVFEAFGIDYCCGGHVSLAQACAARNVNPHDVLAQLERVTATDARGSEIWLDAPLTALCDHIEQTHHAYLKTELPRLAAMLDKVVRAHGAKHPEMALVQQAFADLRAELEPHMFKEEQTLFPAIRRLEQSSRPATFPFGTIENPIRMMEHEHDNAGNCLRRIRELTADFRIPDDVCNTYRAVLDGLHSLEHDMHIHIHKENSILFPRAADLEKSHASAF